MALLDDIRNKPDHVKQHMAFGVALGLTLIIGLVWMSTLPTKLSNTATLTETKEEILQHNMQLPEPEVKERASFGEMFSGIREQFGAVVEGVSQLKNIQLTSDDVENEGEMVAEVAIEEADDEPVVKEREVPIQIATTTPKKQTILIGTTTKPSEQNSE